MSGRKRKVMKPNKEIKPFKMRCESKEEFNKIKDVLIANDIRSIACSGDDDLLINAYLCDCELVYTTFNKHFEEPEPEITYSEFMKLYGEEEEVFTREDMKEFSEYVAAGYSRIYLAEGYRYVYKGRERDWNNSFTIDKILTIFLSEPTNG